MLAFILFAAALEALFWIGAVYWSKDPSQRFDPASIHGIFFFLVLPAVGLALWGRWLRVAVGLALATAFMFFSVLVKIGSNKNATLGYRFDEKPGHEPKARFLADFRTAVLEEKAEVAQFVGELATSNLLYVRIRSLNAGRSTAEFRLNGAPAAIEAAFANCPLSADRPGRRAGS